MTPYSGVLLTPGMPHRYESNVEAGTAGILRFMGVWLHILCRIWGGKRPNVFNGNPAMTGLHGSLKACWSSPNQEETRRGGQTGGTVPFSDAPSNRSTYRQQAIHVEAPVAYSGVLLDWLENGFPDPGIGLAEMAARLGIGERQLNERFRELFGQNGYCAFSFSLDSAKRRNGFPSARIGPYAASGGCRFVTPVILWPLSAERKA